MTAPAHADTSAEPLLVSVVVPARNVTADLHACLAALERQSMPTARYEVIVALDARDPAAGEGSLAGSRATFVRQKGIGAPGARNDGLAVARGRWIAFTDSDCRPSRTWLATLVGAAEAAAIDGRQVLGAAGQVVGYESTSRAARYVDLTGGLDAKRHLTHPRYPWAPTANALYARDALLRVGGFDARFATYEGCDLHTRLLREVGGQFVLEPRAVVLHRHRDGWRQYWRQQVNYGRGYAQFVRAYGDEIPWSVARELGSWLRLVPEAAGTLLPGTGDERLVRRGTFVKSLAQRLGFASTLWSPRDRRRWREAAAVAGLPLPVRRAGVPGMAAKGDS